MDVVAERGELHYNISDVLYRMDHYSLTENIDLSVLSRFSHPVSAPKLNTVENPVMRKQRAKKG